MNGHHITIGGETVCTYATSIAGRDALERAGVKKCARYLSEEAAEKDAAKLRALFKPGGYYRADENTSIVAVVPGECPVAIKVAEFRALPVLDDEDEIDDARLMAGDSEGGR